MDVEAATGGARADTSPPGRLHRTAREERRDNDAAARATGTARAHRPASVSAVATISTTIGRRRHRKQGAAAESLLSTGGPAVTNEPTRRR